MKKKVKEEQVTSSAYESEQERILRRFYDITPENDFCLQCKNTKCNGECKEFKAYMKAQGKKGRKKSWNI